MKIEHGPPGARGVTQLQYVGDEHGGASGAQRLGRIMGVAGAGVALLGWLAKDRGVAQAGGAAAAAGLLLQALSR